MHIKNKVLAVFAFAVLVAPGISLAQVATPVGMPSAAELQAEIQALLAQLQTLQAQLAAQEGGSCYTFTSNVSLGQTGTAVTNLQAMLQKDGEQVQGTGSFDDQTASAVSAFQEKYRSDVLAPAGLSAGTGYVGSRTIAKLNALFGCGTSPSQPPQVASSSIAQPTITEVSGKAATAFQVYAGEPFDIQGYNFSAPDSVYICGESAAITQESAGDATDLIWAMAPNNLKDNCYVYVTNSNGTSNQIYVTVGGSTITLPASYLPAPAAPNLTANGPTSVTISWPAVAGATSYHISRTPPNMDIDTVTGTSFTDVNSGYFGMTCGTPYQYRIEACNSNSCSSWGPWSSVTTGACSTTPITPVTSTPIVVSPSSVSVSLDPTTPASANVVMGTTGVTVASYRFTNIGTGPVALSQVVVNDMASGNASLADFVNYRLMQGTTQVGNIVATESNPGGAVVFNLSPGVSVPAYASVMLNLVADANSYAQVQTSGGTHSFALIGIIANGQTQSVSNVVGNTMTTVSVTVTPVISVVPATPSTEAATPMGPTSISFYWSAVSGATSYHISRNPPNADINTVTSTSFWDNGSYGMTCGTTYQYRVEACNNYGCSSWSPWLSVSVNPSTCASTASH